MADDKHQIYLPTRQLRDKAAKALEIACIDPEYWDRIIEDGVDRYDLRKEILDRRKDGP